MAKSISEEELQLRKRARRRLVGAIALVTIVAVFLPMAFLSGITGIMSNIIHSGLFFEFLNASISRRILFSFFWELSDFD